MTKHRPEEVWAAECLRLAMPDVEVQFHDDNSQPSMHDLDLLQNGRRFGVCEVTSTTDQEFAEAWNRLNGSNDVLTVNELHQSWLVEIVPARKENRLRSELPTLLRQIESRGVGTSRNVMGLDLPESADLEELGVLSLYAVPTEQAAGRVFFTVFPGWDRTGGVVPTSGNDLAKWLGSWLAEPKQRDNAAKLVKTASGERHIFVIFPGVSLAPFSVTDVLNRDDAPLPTTDPQLPEGITHLWAAGTWSSGSVFGWGPGSGWSRSPKPESIRFGEE